nr:glycosyltransferase [Opitutaceae bacterium]
CPDDAVTFGSFNTPAKLSDTTLRLWADVLRAVPRARLLLKGHGFDDPRTGAAWLDRLAALGCDPARVELVGRVSSPRDHLALYARVDVALDPFPYHGTTTTCEALWMGRPVVVLAGAEHRSRVGVSLLHAAGHPEWIAYQPEDYIRIAAGLAADPALRRALAAGLRADLARGPLLDHAGRARDFAAALRACHARAV